jgi:release factor glutamine methyltransferase
MEKKWTAKLAQNWVLSEISASYEAGEAQIVSRMLIEWVTGQKAYHWIGGESDYLTDNQIEMIEQVLGRINNGEPIQYILGESWFYGRRFGVNPAVLIPRPETEEICYQIIHHYKQHRGLRILDAGTGSGCIACTLQLELVDSAVWALDVSESALHVARDNARENGAKVTFLEDNLLNLQAALPNDLDLLVSNPPYIPATEIREMARRVSAYEPHLALFTPDGDPFVFYRQLSELGKRLLKPGGRIVTEVHELYSQGVRAIFEAGGYERVEIRRDMQGKERSVWGEFVSSS